MPNLEYPIHVNAQRPPYLLLPWRSAPVGVRPSTRSTPYKDVRGAVPHSSPRIAQGQNTRHEQ